MKRVHVHGIQTDSEDELVALKAQAQAADLSLQDEGETSCCYARSDKYWVTDPQGIAWEQFHTLHDTPTFGVDRAAEPTASACCAAAARPNPVAVKASGGCC